VNGGHGVLNWMDRSDVAGLNAPRLIRLHYGELDKPGPDNNSASYNETVQPALAELRTIYRAFGAESKVSLYVTPNSWHEIDNDDLRQFLATRQLSSGPSGVPLTIRKGTALPDERRPPTGTSEPRASLNISVFSARGTNAQTYGGHGRGMNPARSSAANQESILP